jgi:hypothetical protein
MSSEEDKTKSPRDEEGVFFGVIPNAVEKIRNIPDVVTEIPRKVATNITQRVGSMLTTVDNTLLTVKEYKGDVKKRIDAIGEIASFGGELTEAVAIPIVESAIKSSPTVMAAKIAAKVAADTAAKAAGTIGPVLQALPLPSATPPPKPTAGGGNNQIGGLKQLVNEKKIITKRIAKTLKSFHRTNTRKRRRKGKSKRVRFAL